MARKKRNDAVNLDERSPELKGDLEAQLDELGDDRRQVGVADDLFLAAELAAAQNENPGRDQNDGGEQQPDGKVNGQDVTLRILEAAVET